MNARSAFERCDRRGTPAYFQYTDTQTDRRRATAPRGDPPYANRGSISQFFGGARLASREACSRARARDERGSEATERIGWGGCGKGAPGCHRSSRSHNHHQHIESAGEGVAKGRPAVTGHLVHKTTSNIQNRPQRTSLKMCPGVAQSYRMERPITLDATYSMRTPGCTVPVPRPPQPRRSRRSRRPRARLTPTGRSPERATAGDGVAHDGLLAGCGRTPRPRERRPKPSSLPLNIARRRSASPRRAGRRAARAGS